MVGKFLTRGLAAGLIAGVLAGLFGLAFGEPVLDRAIASSSHAEHSHGGHTHEESGGGHSHGEEEEAFGRGAQKAGLVIGTALYGAFAGSVFGVVSAFLRGRSEMGGWVRSLTLAAAVFAGAVLMPFLKYPPSPPGGEPTMDQTPAYLAMVVLSLAAVFFAWRISRRMADAPVPARHLSVAGFILVSFAALYALLPSAAGAGEMNAGLLWQFRLSSLGTQAVLWTAIGCVFGILCERLERGERRGERRGETAAEAQ